MFKKLFYTTDSMNAGKKRSIVFVLQFHYSSLARHFYSVHVVRVDWECLAQTDITILRKTVTPHLSDIEPQALRGLLPELEEQSRTRGGKAAALRMSLYSI